MNHPKKERITGRKRRAKRVRKKVFGTAEKPRLSVFRSLKNISAQLIDDKKGVSIFGVSSSNPEIRKQKFDSRKIGEAEAVGKIVAEKAKGKGITEVVFDRSGYLYHGRVKAVAEGARKGGLKF